MIQTTFTVEQNRGIARDTFELKLRGDTAGLAPGRFVELKTKGGFLRRPISVCDYDAERLILVCRTVGGGTRELSALSAGERVDALSGLGNGFTPRLSKGALLIGGGIGISPLYALARRMPGCTAILGFNSIDEVFYEEEFRRVCARVFITTADGSAGIRGYVTDALQDAGVPDYYYACGPYPMLKAVASGVASPGEVSMEERMACGFGVCRGCTIKTRLGDRSVCKDGPVFDKEAVIWT